MKTDAVTKPSSKLLKPLLIHVSSVRLDSQYEQFICQKCPQTHRIFSIHRRKASPQLTEVSLNISVFFIQQELQASSTFLFITFTCRSLDLVFSVLMSFSWWHIIYNRAPISIMSRSSCPTVCSASVLVTSVSPSDIQRFVSARLLCLVFFRCSFNHLIWTVMWFASAGDCSSLQLLTVCTLVGVVVAGRFCGWHEVIIIPLQLTVPGIGC